MSQDKIILSSLALDLRRVAMGYYRGSIPMAERFYEEALKRTKEAKALDLKKYLVELIKKTEELADVHDEKRKAEDAFMYSTLFQNAATTL
jgi:hypothetical protein